MRWKSASPRPVAAALTGGGRRWPISYILTLHQADLARAERLVDQALAVSPRFAFAHLVKGQVLRAQRRWGEAIPEYEAALAFDHNLILRINQSWLV